MKVDSTGKVLWRKAYGSAGREYFKSAEAMPDGGFLLAGDGFGGPWVVRVDSAGNVLWQKRYGMSTGAAIGMSARLILGKVFLVLTGYWGSTDPSEPHGAIVMRLWGDGYPGSCGDPTIGVSTNAVQRSSTVRASGSKAKAAIPSTTTTVTTAAPWAADFTETQLCAS